MRKLSKATGFGKLARREEIYDDLIEFADGTLPFERGCDAFYEYVDPEYEGLWESADEGDEEEDEDNGEDDGSNELDGGDGEDDEPTG